MRKITKFVDRYKETREIHYFEMFVNEVAKLDLSQDEIVSQIVEETKRLLKGIELEEKLDIVVRSPKWQELCDMQDGAFKDYIYRDIMQGGA